MSSFKITSRPAGDAPEWVRDQWVGLTFPFEGDERWNAHTSATGDAPHEVDSDFSVTAGTALQILRESGEEGAKAADWWETESMLARLTSSAGLTFQPHECELIDA